MGNKLLTIIVPTYNMEEYLDKCLSSLIVGLPDCEMMQMLEVLVINDGSTDSSSAIAHEYEEQYPETFIVIDKENGNYGSCINVALPLTTGKYVKLLDADDSFDNVIFVEYLKFLQGVDFDMVYTSYEMVDMQGNSCGVVTLDIPPLKALCLNECPSVYSKMKMHGITYKKALFEGFGYHQTEGVYYSDLEWVHLPMSRVETFVYSPLTLYKYLIGRPGQSMEKAVGLKNYKMAFSVLYSCIDIYLSCQRGGGKWHGIAINMDYLYYHCIEVVENSYFNLLTNQRNPIHASQLQELDESIRTKYPDFYKDLDRVVHPNSYLPCLQIPFRVIHCWHKYGSVISTMQIWVVNRYLGFSSRFANLIRSVGLG